MVYLPPAFTETRDEVLIAHIDRYDFGLLVSHGQQGLIASSLNFDSRSFSKRTVSRRASLSAFSLAAFNSRRGISFRFVIAAIVASDLASGSQPVNRLRAAIIALK